MNQELLNQAFKLGQNGICLFVWPLGGSRVNDEVQDLAEAHLSTMFSAAPAEGSDTGRVVPHKAPSFSGLQQVVHLRATEKQEDAKSAACV